MARFCTQCGRPLAEGEVCQCQQQKRENNQQASGGQGNTYGNYGQASGGQGNTYGNYGQASGGQGNAYGNYGQASGGQGNAYGNYGQAFGGQGNAYGNQDGGYETQQDPKNGNMAHTSNGDGIPFRKLIGIGESDQNDVTGCFERGKKIVPELIAPCEQEIPVKQYHICNARSRMRGLWQEGRIQVTNKRVIFRLSGRSWIGKAMSHIEFTIDEVAGISLSNGVRFALWDFILGFLISVLAFMLGRAIGAMPALLSYLLAIVLAAPFFVLKKKYFIKALCLAGSAGMLLSSAFRQVFEHPGLMKTGMFLAVIVLILYIVALFLFALKPSLSISVMTKCASDEPIYIWSRQTMVSVMEVLPGEDADVAIEELGAMITDIQKLGDFGIKKWKEE